MAAKINMENVGFMNKRQLNAILAGLRKLKCDVKETAISCVVTTPKGVAVMQSALIKQNGKAMWHVRAVHGLITKREIPNGPEKPAADL